MKHEHPTPSPERQPNPPHRDNGPPARRVPEDGYVTPRLPQPTDRARIGFHAAYLPGHHEIDMAKGSKKGGKGKPMGGKKGMGC